MAIYNWFKVLRSAETEWGQALFESGKCLTRKLLLAQSVQSIMGATEIFLWVFRTFASIQKVIYKGISAVLL
jgi:hypothetical protein